MMSRFVPAQLGQADLRLDLVRLITEPRREFLQFRGPRPGLLVPVAHQQGPDELAEDLGPYPGGALRQTQRRLQVIELAWQQQLLPKRCAQPQQGRGQLRVAGLIEAAEGRLHQRQAAVRHTGQPRGLGRDLYHPRPVRGDLIGRVRRTLPQVEHQFQHLQLLRISECRTAASAAAHAADSAR